MKIVFYIALSLLLINSMHSYAQPAETSDTLLMVKMDEINVTAERKWMNDTAWYRYNQTKYYIKSILPYLKEATILFNELQVAVNDPNLRKRDRKSIINAREDQLKEKFEKDIKKLNETQGMLLMKLIGRQTGVNIYEMLKEFKNPLTAIKWQAYARLNGFNINRTYVPEEEPMLEAIMESLGYPLPAAIYGNQEIPKLKNY